MAQWVRKGGLGKVEDILHHIVPERVLDQGIGIRSDLADKMSLLIARCMIDTALENTTSVTVSANHNTMSPNRIEDELWFVSRQLANV